MNNPFFEDRARCTECGGKCCKHCPGAYHSSDTIPGDAVLDFVILVDGNQRKNIYYPRPAIKGRESRKVDPFGKGECAHFTEGKGCSMSAEERPMQCRDLIPMEPQGRCLSNEYDLSACALSWANETQQSRLSGMN